MAKAGLHPTVIKWVEERASKYPTKRSLLVPTLLLAQKYHDGWMSKEIIIEVAKLLDVPEQEVHSVASFYALLNKHPVGRHVILVCHNISCHLRGADELISKLEEKLGIEVGQTTQDGRFTLLSVECIAACGGAPAMMIDQQYFENVTLDKLDEILAMFE